MPTKNDIKTIDILTTTSYLWDNNPKLLQVLNLIDFSNSKEVKATKTTEYKGEAYFLDLFSGMNKKQLERIFQQSNHWFNQAEIAFIIESWLKRKSRIEELTEQMMKVYPTQSSQCQCLSSATTQ